MKVSLRFALAATTALVTFVHPVSADPVSISIAAAATIAGGAATAAIAGTAIVWSAILGQAAVAGLLAGVSSLLAPDQPKGPTAQDITLNRITPVTYGRILYGERMLGGSIVARSTTKHGKKENGIYHSVIPLACHEIDGVHSVYVGEDRVWSEDKYVIDEAAGTDPTAWWGLLDPKYHDKIFIRAYMGTSDQQAEPVYVAEASEWTEASRGRGVAYLYFRAVYNADLFPRGVEAVRARVRGKKVYDPRTGLTEYSANPALHVRDYALLDESLGGIGYAENDIDDAAIIALANIADEDVALSGGGTEKRYEFNGVLDTESTPETNLGVLSTSWGGWQTYSEGMLTVGGGAFEAVTESISEDDMVAPIRVRARRAFEDQFNVVKAVYADPEQEYVPTDLPVLQSATYRAQDNGEELIRDLGELPGETSYSRAQRLMKLSLLKGRRQKSVDVVCNLSKVDIALGDNVGLTVERRGWVDKTFEVTGKTITIAPGNVQVALSLLESGPEVFDWETSEETPKPAGSVPTLADPNERPIVTAPAASEALYQTRGGGGVKTRVTLTAETDSPFVDSYEFSWRLTDGSVEVVLPVSREGVAIIDDVAPGVYVFGARVRTKRGINSLWVYGNARSIVGVNGAPVAIENLVVQSAGGSVALIRWDRHPSIDVQQGGRIEFRHSPSLTGATWQTSTSIGKSVSGGNTDAALPLKEGTYLARPFDAQNIPGPTVEVVTRAPSLASLSLTATVTEGAGFSGVKTNCAVDGSTLVLDEGEVAAEYYFAGQIDLGAVESVRLVSDIEVSIGRRDDLFWDRGGTKFWQRGGDLFWQSGAAFGDVDLQVSETDDDPSGSPTWGDYRSFDASDFSARGFRFRALLTAENTDFEVRISGLEVRAFQEA